MPWTAHPDGVTLAVRLTPKGGQDIVQGVETLADGRRVLKAKVRAVPEDGKANAALEKLIAKALNLAPSRVRVTSGATSRVKTLDITGDPASLAASLRIITGEQP